MKRIHYLIIAYIAIHPLFGDNVKENLKVELSKALESNNRLLFEKTKDQASSLEQLTDNFVNCLDFYQTLLKDKLERQNLSFSLDKIVLQQHILNLYSKLNDKEVLTSSESSNGQHDWNDAKCLAIRIMDARHQLKENPSALEIFRPFIPADLLRKWSTDAFKDKEVTPIIAHICLDQGNEDDIHSFIAWNKEKTFLAKLTIVKEMNGFLLDEICETKDTKLINKLLKKYAN